MTHLLKAHWVQIIVQELISLLVHQTQIQIMVDQKLQALGSEAQTENTLIDDNWFPIST